ncbi:hypothetical protein [Quadrisphaera setariae]|uniref:Uncharacterized protein n=1 Tax=Quadrisphaera setariae TaxID=2593304 RepID=A0A5C8ZLV8_9ACTN|nr:hypothetical protein [Quadrisphaera setariae]TXR58171.1 hypothetical protein FMM08_03035 [Quadrisphaera setariae]
MAADPRGPGDSLEQLRADRERHRAEERADAPSSSSVPPPDWRHDTLELDLDGLGHEPAGPPPVVDGSVLRSRTHGGGWRAVRQGSSAAAKKVRRVRVPAGLVVGLVLVVGAGATSAVLDGSGSGPQTSPLQTTTQTGTGTTQGSTTTAGDRPQGSVRVETGGSADGSDAGRAPEQDAGLPPDPQAGPAAGAPGGPGAAVDQAAGPGAGTGGGGPAGGPRDRPAAGPGAGPVGAPGRP